MDPREQWTAFRDMEAIGETLLAIYHSHPVTPAYPSPIDRAEAHYPDALYVLVSLRTAEPEVRAYHVNGEWVREAHIPS